MQATFRRGTEQLIVQLRTEFATGEYLVVSIFPSGKEQAERFGSQEQALAYFKFMEERLGGQQWTRELLPGDSGDPPKPIVVRPVQVVHTEEPAPAPVPAVHAAQAAHVAPLETEDSGKYALGRPLQCPHCHEWIREIDVVRLTRVQAAFTSTLPRSGRALACPSCDGLLSAELARFI